MSKIKFYFAFVLLGFLIFHPLKAGGPWVPQKGAGVFILGVSPNVYNQIAGRNGTILLNRMVTDATLNAYLEQGVVKNLGLWANIPLRWVRTGNNLTERGEFLESLPAGSLVGLANTELGIKYQFLRKGRWRMAGTLGVYAPSRGENFEQGLRVGYDTWALLPGLTAGIGIDERRYFQASAHMALRDNSYDDVFHFGIEYGFKLKKRPVWLAFLFQGRVSLNNDSRFIWQNDLQTGLYLPGEQYLAWSFKWTWEVQERISLNGSLGGGVPGTLRYIAQTPAISLGVMTRWGKR